jgi:hypothetical protein
MKAAAAPETFAQPLAWRAPSSTPSAPPAPMETAMGEPEIARAEQHPERAAGANGDRDLDGYSPTGRRLIAFFERVLGGEGAE